MNVSKSKRVRPNQALACWDDGANDGVAQPQMGVLGGERYLPMTTMKSKRIILTGFMGTGKSAVGEKLAAKLRFEFLDTDLMVEDEVGKTITEIFEKEGETYFRSQEKKMVKKALVKEKVVIATGGGAIVDPENLKLMKEKGFVIGLTASPEAILERVNKMETRPLLKSKDKLKKIEDMLSHRSPYYRQADKIINTTNKKIDDTIREILKTIQSSDD